MTAAGCGRTRRRGEATAPQRRAQAPHFEQGHAFNTTAFLHKVNRKLCDEEKFDNELTIAKNPFTLWSGVSGVRKKLRNVFVILILAMLLALWTGTVVYHHQNYKCVLETFLTNNLVECAR